jgi:hypothetical protein
MATARETGITCDQCGAEFCLHEEYVYFYGRKLHQECASAEAATRREAGHDPVTAAGEILEAGSRVVLSRSQLRALVTLAVAQGLEPVRKPDSGRQKWFGRMPGWSAEHVQTGLSAAEVAGLWLDFMDVGRMPPLRRADLSILMDVIDQDVISRDLSVIMDVIDAPSSIVTSP